jgi:hypothetical protein
MHTMGPTFIAHNVNQENILRMLQVHQTRALIVKQDITILVLEPLIKMIVRDVKLANIQLLLDQ